MKVNRDLFISHVSYEVERIHEIYSILFPHSFILVILAHVSGERLSEAKEISSTHAGDLLSIGTSKITTVEVGKEYSHFPNKIFLIHYCDDTQSDIGASQLRPSYSLRQRIYQGIRRGLMSLDPLLYESVKYRFLSILERRRPFMERLPNVRNPKDKPPISKSHANILFCIHWLDVGGAEKFAMDCCEFAANKGREVYVAVSHMSRPFYRNRLTKIAKVYELERQIPREHRQLFLSKLIASKNISLVHNHHSRDFYEALPLCRVLFPSLVTIDSLHIDEKNRFAGGFPRTSLVWSNYIDWHHVISKRLFNYFVDREVNSSRVVLGYLTQGMRRAVEFSCPTSLDSKRLKIAFVGRMTPQKRPLLALSMITWAIRFGLKKGISISAEIVGDGYYLATMKKIVARSGLASSIVFHEADCNVDSVLRSSDVLLLTSENEGITLVGYEAYEAGTLVVSTDVGGQNELVADLLLLPDAPLAAYRRWKNIVVSLIDDDTFLEASIKGFHSKVGKILDADSAESVLTRIYEV